MLLFALRAIELTLAQFCLADLVEGDSIEVIFDQLLEFCHATVVGTDVVGWIDEGHVVLARGVALYRSIVHYEIIIIKPCASQRGIDGCQSISSSHFPCIPLSYILYVPMSPCFDCTHKL